MAMTMEAPATLDGPVEPKPTKGEATEQSVEQPTEQATDQPAAETIQIDEANAELQEVGNETQAEIGQAEADSQAVEAAAASTVSEEDRRFWAEVAVLGKLTECNRNIKESENTIDDLKCQIKEEKELLKGEQIRLQRLASELADIIEGKPLPIDPNAKKEETPKADGSQDYAANQDSETPDDSWRDTTTADLLDGLKGLGAKKLETLVDAAPTVGHLEDLRGEASRAHLSFKEKLPSGFGQKIADAIEDRLVEHVAKCSPSAEEQAAAEREAEQPINIDKISIGIREQLERQRKHTKSKDDFAPEDLDDLDDPFVDGWLTYLDGTPINAVEGCETATDEGTAREWLCGWLTSQMVHHWDDQDPASDAAPDGEVYEDVEEDDAL